MAEQGMQLAKAYVQIVPTTKGIKGSIEREIAPESDRSGKEAGRRITDGITKSIKLGTVAIGGALTAVVKSAVDAGGDLQQSIGGIETIYKTSADRMKGFADQAYKTAGISANAYMEQATSFGTSLLQTLGGNTELATEYANRAITDMSDNANKMGTSMELIQNAYQGFAKQNFTMLDNLKLGYGGTQEEMRRLISDASKMTDTQKKLNVAVNDGDLSFSNIVNAISVVQSELGIMGATSLEASKTLQGSFNAMKASATNFFGALSLGEDIEPSLNALITTAGTYLNDNLIPTIGNVFKSLPSAIGTLSDVGYETAMNFLTSLADGFDSNVTALIERAGPMLVTFSEGLKEKIGSFVDIGIELLGQLAQGIADGLPSLIENVPLIISNFANIINENMPKILKLGLDMLVTLGTGIINAIPTLIANIPQIISAILDVWTAFNWFNLGSDVIKKISDGIKGMWGTFKAFIDTSFKNLSGGITSIVSGIKNTVVSVFNAVFSNVKNIWNNVLYAIQNPMTAAKNIVKNIIGAIKGFFNFQFRWPHIPLPHFSVKPRGWEIGDLLKGSIPSLGISWYAKAMDKPMALDGATIFGYQNGNLLGGGEKGTEYITGERGLSKVVADVIDSRLQGMLDRSMTMMDIIVELLKIIADKDPTLVMDGATVAQVIDDRLGDISKNRGRGL